MKKNGVAQDNMHLPTYNFRFENVTVTGTNTDRKQGSVWCDTGKIKIQTGDAGLLTTVKTVAYEEDVSTNYYTKTQINAGLLGNYPITAATASRVLVTDTNGKAEVSSINTTKLGYLTDVSENIGAALSSKEPAITAGTNAQWWRGDKTWQTLTTTQVSEGTNLYWTAARFQTEFDNKGNVVGGFARLIDVGGFPKIPTAYLPSYVDDVVELLRMDTTVPSNPVSGNKYYHSTSKKIFTYTSSWDSGVNPEADKIYTDISTNKTYRWSGTDMVALDAGIVLGSGTPEPVNTTPSNGSSGAAAPYDHVHALGSKVVLTANIADSAITATQIADNAITTAKILDYQVTTNKLVDGAVTTTKISDDAVVNAKLSNMPARTIKANATNGSDNPTDITHVELGAMVLADTTNLISASTPSSVAVVSRYTNTTTLSAVSGIYTFPTAITLSANRKIGGRYSCQVIAHFLSGTDMIPVEVDSKITSAGAVVITWNETIAPLLGTLAANSVVITIIQ